MKQQLFQSKRGARTSPAAGRTLPAVPVSWLCSGWQLLAASPGWQRLLSEQLGCGGSCSTEEVVTEELREPTPGIYSGTPAATAAVLLSHEGQRVGCRWEKQGYMWGPGHCPVILKICCFYSDNLVHAHELHYNILYLFYTGNCRWTPNALNPFPSTKG